MSSGAFRDIRGFLCSSTNVTTLVPKSSIIVGWPRVLDRTPSILITQVAGHDYGYLGYKKSDPGSRLRREEVTFQLDIVTDNRRDGYIIENEITPLLIASGACRKVSDVDGFDDEANVNRKQVSYLYTKFHDD